MVSSEPKTGTCLVEGSFAAMPGADGTPSELVEWLLAAGEDDLHLDHIILRASVAAFSRLDASKQPA